LNRSRRDLGGHAAFINGRLVERNRFERRQAASQNASKTLRFGMSATMFIDEAG
jgi:hypothetical protein